MSCDNGCFQILACLRCVSWHNRCAGAHLESWTWRPRSAPCGPGVSPWLRGCWLPCLLRSCDSSLFSLHANFHLAAVCAAAFDHEKCGPVNLPDKNFCSVQATQPSKLLLHVHVVWRAGCSQVFAEIVCSAETGRRSMWAGPWAATPAGCVY